MAPEGLLALVLHQPESATDAAVRANVPAFACPPVLATARSRPSSTRRYVRKSCSRKAYQCAFLLHCTD